jgi:hypothetical protein
MDAPGPLNSLDEIISAAEDASLDDFLETLYAALELDVHVGIEELDDGSGLVILTAPMYESMSSNPKWLRKTTVSYPISLFDFYAIVRRLDAEQIREWEGEGNLDDRLGKPCG